MKIRIIITVIIATLFMHSAGCLAQQDSDSLSLSLILGEVIENYPAIKKTLYEKEAADARIGMARSGYLPDVGISSSYSHIGPSSSITLPGMGTFSLFPQDNYSASLNYQETLYDFGRTAKNIELEKSNKQVTELSASQLKQKISLSVATLYYNIVFLQEAIKIKDQEIEILNRHLGYVEKKNQTGSATGYDVMTTRVKIAATENQKTDLESLLKGELARLNSFLGNDPEKHLVLEKDLQSEFATVTTDSLISTACNTRNEMRLAEQRTTVSALKYQLVRSQNNPVISFFASAGIKNGYTPDINQGRANYAVGVGVRIPVFDAGRKKHAMAQVSAEVNGLKEDEEMTRRNIGAEVTENIAAIESARQKIKQSELQYRQAEQAYALAETSFNSGVITNLELLDSATSLSEAGLSVLKAKTDFSINIVRLKISIGEVIY